MLLDNEQANHCHKENLSFPFEGELWQLAAQNKEAEELTARILKRFLLYILKFCAHLYSFFETEACLLCLCCTAEAMGSSADPAQTGTLHEEAELCLYQATAGIFSVFADRFILSTEGMRFRLQQLLHVCISGQLVICTREHFQSSIPVSENHEALQQNKLGEQGFFTFFSQEDKTKSLLSNVTFIQVTLGILSCNKLTFPLQLTQCAKSLHMSIPRFEAYH